MPELPEVETVARQLSTILLNKRIEEVRLIDKKLGDLPSLPYSGAEVTAVERWGKQVILTFLPASSTHAPFYLAVHLRMTGRLLWHPNHHSSNTTSIPSFNYVNEHANSGDQKHRRAVITFTDGRLDFVDVRRFGTFEFETDLKRHQPKGIDPLTDGFTFQNLANLLANSKQNMKQWLLRQDKLVGLGNIYVCEILFLARIHPERIAATLTSQEINSLHSVIPQILIKAIQHCGTTFSDFQDTVGETGSFQSFLQVYQKEGQPCPMCSNPILRTSHQGRSSFFCSSCQH